MRCILFSFDYDFMDNKILNIFYMQLIFNNSKKIFILTLYKKK